MIASVMAQSLHLIHKFLKVKKTRNTRGRDEPMGEPEDPARNAIADNQMPADRSQNAARTGDGQGPAGTATGGDQVRDEEAVYRFIERFSSVLSEAGFPR